MKNDVVKKTEYDKLVEKVNNIDTSGFGLKTKLETEKTELKKNTIAQAFYSELVLEANYIIVKLKLEKKIPETSRLVKKTDYNAKVTEIENKIPKISGLAYECCINCKWK